MNERVVGSFASAGGRHHPLGHQNNRYMPPALHSRVSALRILGIEGGKGGHRDCLCR